VSVSTSGRIAVLLSNNVFTWLYHTFEINLWGEETRGKGSDSRETTWPATPRSELPFRGVVLRRLGLSREKLSQAALYLR